jgi:osmotically-inducible protein OsmY
MGGWQASSPRMICCGCDRMKTSGTRSSTKSWWAAWGANPALVEVTVTGGVVTLAGELGQKSMIPAAFRMAQAVDGVVDVDGQLCFAIDDTNPLYVDTSKY